MHATPSMGRCSRTDITTIECALIVWKICERSSNSISEADRLFAHAMWYCTYSPLGRWSSDKPVTVFRILHNYWYLSSYKIQKTQLVFISHASTNKQAWIIIINTTLGLVCSHFGSTLFLLRLKGVANETTSWCGSPATFFGTQYHKAIAFFVFLLEVPNLIYLHVYSC